MDEQDTKYDVFISYSRKDKEAVHELARRIKSAGFDVWIDWDGIKSGDQFKTLIAEAIKDSRVVLFFSSRAANASDWTVKEINVASNLNKKIIPVKLDNSEYNIGIMMDLAGSDFEDFTDKNTWDFHLDRLCNSLSKGKKNLAPISTPQKSVEAHKHIESRKRYKYDVYICYSGKDNDLGFHALKSELEKAGISFFIEDVDKSELFFWKSPNIEAIENSEIFLLVGSKRTLDSGFALKARNLFFNNHKHEDIAIFADLYSVHDFCGKNSVWHKSGIICQVEIGMFVEMIRLKLCGQTWTEADELARNSNPRFSYVRRECKNI